MSIAVGLVLHPSRDVARAIADVRGWAERAGARIGQLPSPVSCQRVAEPISAAECDLVVAIGGDGTALGAIRQAAAADRPVLGIACGSLGALALVTEPDVAEALERFRRGDWIRRELPALTGRAAGGQTVTAFNDLVISRRGEGQLRVAATVDGELFARFAGDGCIVSTPLGSSAYALASGGPLLPAGLPAYVLTVLPAHGGFRPPLVVAAGSALSLAVTAGFGGARLEVDGQLSAATGEALATVEVALTPAAAALVAFSDSEPTLAGLRRRGIIMDSPRILADDLRRSSNAATPTPPGAPSSGGDVGLA